MNQDSLPPEIGWPLALLLWLAVVIIYRKDRHTVPNTAAPTKPRLILMAATFHDARRFITDYHVRGQVTVVTPRSPYGARGTIADGWLMTPAVSGHPLIAELVREIEPCMHTTEANHG